MRGYRKGEKKKKKKKKRESKKKWRRDVGGEDY